MRALSAGRMDDARMNFDRVIEKRPEWSAAYRQRGYSSSEPDAGDRRLHARGRARRQRRRCLRRARPRMGEGAAGRRRASTTSTARSRSARATASAATTITAWRADRGVARIEAGDAAGALDDLRHAAKARDTPSDHYRLAVALAATGDWAGAREAYDRALATNVQAAVARRARARADAARRRRGRRRRPRALRADGPGMRRNARRSRRPARARPRTHAALRAHDERRGARRLPRRARRRGD